MTNYILWYEAPVRKKVVISKTLSQEFTQWADVCCSGKVVYEKYQKIDNNYWTHIGYGLFFEYEEDKISYLLTWTETETVFYDHSMFYCPYIPLTITDNKV